MSADATQVTGSPLAGPGVPRPGTVLAERYELLEVIETDGPIVGYRALDQENERQVLVRVLAGPGVHTDECDRIVRHLRGLVGIGGRYLSTLLDADREGRAPFTVEAWPRGTPLSTILDARRSRGEALGAREALPVIAQLGAALRALPDGLHHGEVRAERVWLDTHGLRLTGPFLLAALPSDELGERVEKLGPGAVAYAPELRSGHSGPASDLWGVGAIAWEALTGRSPDPSGRAPEVQGKLHDTLTALLADAPERRSPSLDALLRAIAARADLSVPMLDPEPHQPPTAIVAAMDAGGTEPGSAPGLGLATASDEHGLDPRLVRAALGVSLDIEDRTGPNDTAKLPSVSASLAESLDPRLVRAALDVSLESSSDQHALPSDSGSHGLDPRLVRAALGVEMDSAESLEMELLDDEAPAAPASSQPTLPKPTLPKPTLPKPTLPKPTLPKPTLPKPARPEAASTAEAAPPKPRVVVPNVRPFPAPGPGALRAHASDAAPASPRPVPSWPPAPKVAPAPPTARGQAGAAPRPRPAPATPAPPPVATSPAPPVAPSPAPSRATPAPAEPPTPAVPMPLPAAAAPAPTPPAAVPSATPFAPPPAAASSSGAPMAGFEAFEGGTAIVEPKHRRYAPAPKRRKAGLVIVVIAVLLAVAIVGVGFLIAGQRRADAARARELDRMLEALRDSQRTPTAVDPLPPG